MMRKLLAVAIAVNAGAAVPWWFLLWLHPASRRWFLPASMPDVALLSFALGDVLLYITLGLLAAYGIWHRTSWALAVLFIHTGACCYASLFTLHQWFLTGQAALSALAMLPSLLLLPYSCWFLSTNECDSSRPAGK